MPNADRAPAPARTTSTWITTILQIASSVSNSQFTLWKSNLEKKYNKRFVFWRQWWFNMNEYTGPINIGDHCQVHSVCQERFNFALCNNEQCKCITGYHFVNVTRSCVLNQGTIHKYNNSFLFFYNSKIHYK